MEMNPKQTVLTPGDVARWLITACILVLVWQNVHWSVALAITGLSVNAEVIAIWMRVIRRRL